MVFAMARSWLSVTSDVIIPTALAVGAGIFTFTITSSRASDEERFEKDKHSTFLQALTTDIFSVEEVRDEKYMDHEYAQREDLDSLQGDMEEDIDFDVNTSLSKRRSECPKDFTYTIELLEKQAFGQELILKHLKEGVPDWANDMITHTQDLMKEMRTLKGQDNSSSSSLTCGCCCCSAGGRKNNKGSASAMNRNSIKSISVTQDGIQTSPVKKECAENNLESNIGVEVGFKERLKCLESFLNAIVYNRSTLEGKNLPNDENSCNQYDVLRAACNTLIMYLSKIVEQPTVTRYKKISTNNTNFVNFIQPLNNYEELLSLLGFERKANFYHYVISDKFDKGNINKIDDINELGIRNEYESEDVMKIGRQDATRTNNSSFLHESITVLTKAKTNCCPESK